MQAEEAPAGDEEGCMKMGRRGFVIGIEMDGRKKGREREKKMMKPKFPVPNNPLAFPN